MEEQVQQVEELYSLRTELENEIEKVKGDISVAKTFPLRQLVRKSKLAKKIDEVDSKIGILTTVSEANRSVDTIASGLGNGLKQLRKDLNNPKSLTTLEKQIQELEKISRKTIQQLKATSIGKSIAPKVTVIPPNIKLVDANIAYKYADLQKESNLVTAFCTFFGGTAASFLVTAITTTQETLSVVIFSGFLFSFISFLAFGFFCWRSTKKSADAKETLENEAGVKRVTFRLVQNQLE